MMSLRSVVLMTVMATCILTLACGDDDPSLPAPEGKAIWNFLQETDYQQNWELWPGKGELYQGGEPHGALFTTYLNPTAFDALQDKAGSIPSGGIIVKENYTPDAVFDLITLMYKMDGFDPENNDWFWAKISAVGDVQAEGKVVGCQACHGGAKANDFVLTAPLR